MARRVEPEIIDVELSNGRGYITNIPTFRPYNIKKDYKSFVIANVWYGLKAFLNFVGWSIKETVKLSISGLKYAAEGNKEMNEDLRRNRPIYENDSNTRRYKSRSNNQTGLSVPRRRF
jgi:hypothetical protein